MRNPIDIDSKHSRAIVREIGEGLRASFKEDRRVTRELQNANRTTPPIRRRDAAQRLSRVFERHERFALRQFDRLFKTPGPGHDTTPNVAGRSAREARSFVLLRMKGGLLGLRFGDQLLQSVEHLAVGNGGSQPAVSLNLVVERFALITHGQGPHSPENCPIHQIDASEQKLFRWAA